MFGGHTDRLEFHRERAGRIEVYTSLLFSLYFKVIFKMQLVFIRVNREQRVTTQRQ